MNPFPGSIADDEASIADGWNRVVRLLPVVDLFPEEERTSLLQTFEAIYRMGWMDGNMTGMTEGMKLVANYLGREEHAN